MHYIFLDVSVIILNLGQNDVLMISRSGSLSAMILR